MPRKQSDVQEKTVNVCVVRNVYCKPIGSIDKLAEYYQLHDDDDASDRNIQQDEADFETAVPINILSKSVKKKVVRVSRNGKVINDSTSADKKARTRNKPPTTCYQCGEVFETGQAYVKHHRAAHPRTSPYPPEKRAKCNICGVLLSPSSIFAHNNIHTRKNTVNCEICSKSFLSNVALRRHLLSHTGEKPYSCAICDKKFSQSTGVKMHYKTVHLREPYPKRNRCKNNEGQRTVNRKRVVNDETSCGIQLEMASESESENERVTCEPVDENVKYVYIIPRSNKYFK